MPRLHPASCSVGAIHAPCSRGSLATLGLSEGQGLPLDFLDCLNSSRKVATFLKFCFWINEHLVTIQSLLAASEVTLLMRSPCLLSPTGQIPPQDNPGAFPRRAPGLKPARVCHSLPSVCRHCLFSPPATEGERQGGKADRERAAEVTCEKGSKKEETRAQHQEILPRGARCQTEQWPARDGERLRDFWGKKGDWGWHRCHRCCSGRRGFCPHVPGSHETQGQPGMSTQTRRQQAPRLVPRCGCGSLTDPLCAEAASPATAGSPRLTSRRKSSSWSDAEQGRKSPQ